MNDPSFLDISPDFSASTLSFCREYPFGIINHLLSAVKSMFLEAKNCIYFLFFWVVGATSTVWITEIIEFSIVSFGGNVHFLDIDWVDRDFTHQERTLYEPESLGDQSLNETHPSVSFSTYNHYFSSYSYSVDFSHYFSLNTFSFSFFLNLISRTSGINHLEFSSAFRADSCWYQLFRFYL